MGSQRGRAEEHRAPPYEKKQDVPVAIGESTIRQWPGPSTAV
jgi:hypothetical protein